MRALLLLLVLFPSVAYADWKVVAEKVKESIVLLESNDSVCTGFVINQPNNIIVSAAHCYGEDMFVDGVPVIRILNKDVKKDILIVQVAGNFDKPAIKLASEAPKLGEEIASIGYGYNLHEPFFRVHHISSTKHRLGDEVRVSVDIPFLPGMSGGPVVNASGEAVGLAILSNYVVGFFTSTEDLRSKAARYAQ